MFGKKTIAEEFAKQEYRSYIKIDFANIRKDVSDAFKDIAGLGLANYSCCEKSQLIEPLIWR